MSELTEAQLKTQAFLGEIFQRIIAQDEGVRVYGTATMDAAFTNRRIDPVSGYLIVEDNIFTEAGVSPYRGREIQGYEELGLDQDRIYNVYRPFEEIQKGVASLRGVPVFDEHPPEQINKDNFEKYKHLMIGAVGSDVAARDNGARGTMSFYDAAAIGKILSDEQRKLSCGYQHILQQQEGLYDGVGYDLVMRDLNYNHVALVKQGRVVAAQVNDSMEGLEMPNKVKASPPQAAVKDAEGEKPEEKMDETITTETSPAKVESKKDAGLEERIKAAEDALDALMQEKAAKDELPSEIEKKSATGASDGAPVDIDALYHAVKDKVVAQFRERDKALDLSGSLVSGAARGAFDTADDVYRYALKRKGLEAPEGINTAGLEGMVKALSVSARGFFGSPRVAASDAATMSSVPDDIQEMLASVKLV